jgi:membrane protein YqaA with SNARE-associated domain/outer membrane lipoprotein-sorting protein
MSFLSSISQWLVNTLEPYGAPGLMLIAICDSSFLSLPEVNDAALMALSINNPASMWELAAMTVIGSIIGCSLLYAVGRRGGETLLQKRFAADRVQRIRSWYQKYGMLAVIVPSLLPPPLPFKIFVLCAGAFQISWTRFIIAVGIGRSIRYFAEGLLAVWYGKQALQIVADNFPIFGIVLATLIVAAAFIYVFGRRRRASAKLLAPLLLFLMGSGCIRNRAVPEGERLPPSFPLSREQAIQRLEQMGQAIQSLQTAIRLEGSTASLKEEFKRPTSPTMSGTLIMKRPNGIYLKGSLVLSIFEMVSDGTKYQVYVNHANQVYDGSEDGPPSKPFSHLGDLANQFVNLRPKQIQQALMPDVRPLLKDPSLQDLGERIPEPRDRRTYYIFAFVNVSKAREARYVQKFWFDLNTQNFDVVRRQTYDSNGELETDTRYFGHQSLEGALRYPSRIEIQFLATNTLIKIQLDPKDAVFNGDVPDEALQFPPHPGAKVFNFEPRTASVTQQR